MGQVLRAGRGFAFLVVTGCARPPAGPVTASEANPISFTRDGYSGQSGATGPSGGGTRTNVVVIVPVRSR